MLATRSPNNTLIEAPIGIAPRFPKLKPFLQSYTLGWANWEDEALPVLRRYGVEGAGFSFGTIDETTLTYSFNHAGSDLEQASMGLRWHALQAALASGAGTRKKAAKTAVRDQEAALAEYRKQAGSKRHLGAMTYADSHLDADNTPDDTRRSDEEISAMDHAIACAMATDGYAASEIAHAILVGSPHLSVRKAGKETPYASETAEQACKAPEVTEWIASRAAAQSSKESVQAHIGADWQAAWRRAVAYCHWACQMRTISGMGLFHYTVGTVGNCLVLGWHDWALSLAKRARESIGRDFYAAAQSRQRTQFFLLRLLDDWQGNPGHDYPPEACDDPLFTALLEQWRTPDPATIAPLLLAACDRHTHHAKHIAEKSDPDFPDRAWWYDPFEILAVLYLRKLEGLANPDLAHPLLATPIGALPNTVPPYSDDLLEAVIRQAARERSELVAS